MTIWLNSVKYCPVPDAPERATLISQKALQRVQFPHSVSHVHHDSVSQGNETHN